MTSSSTSPVRSRAVAAAVALACAGVASGAPLALAQPKPATTAKAAAPKASGSAAASSTASVPDQIEGSEEVQRLYMEGEDALKRLAFTEAESMFTKAWALSKSFDVAGRLGETKLDMGKYRDAAQYLSFALRNAAPSTRASRREALKKALDDAKKKLATVKLSASVVEARIAIDGTPLDPIFLGPEIFVDPGKHAFEATADGYLPAKQAVDTKPGEIFVVTLTLEKTSSHPLPSGAPTTPPPTSTPWQVMALGGGGALGIIFGAIFVGVGEARKADAYSLSRATLVNDKPSCPKQGPGPNDACDKLRAATSDADTFGNGGIGAFIAGGVLLAAASGYVLFLSPKEPAKEPAKAARFVPVVSPQGGGVLLRGSF